MLRYNCEVLISQTKRKRRAEGGFEPRKERNAPAASAAVKEEAECDSEEAESEGDE